MINKTIVLNLFKQGTSEHIMFDHILKNYNVKNITPKYYEGDLTSGFPFNAKKIYIGRITCSATIPFIISNLTNSQMMFPPANNVEYPITFFASGNNFADSNEITTALSQGYLTEIKNELFMFKSIQFNTLGHFVGYEITLE